MASKPLLWEFTPKDLIMAFGFVITVVSHYYGTLNAFEKYKAGTDAKLEIINFRLRTLEKGNNKVVYTEPTEAVLPQSPRFKRSLNLMDVN